MSISKVIFSLDSFINITKNINFLMKDYNITLNFEGFTNTINSFYSLDINDIYDAWCLEKEFSLWEIYFSSLHQVLEYIKNDLLLICNHKISQLSLYYSKDDKSYGDTLALRDVTIQEYLRKVKLFETYTKELYIQIQTITRALHQCRYIYKNSNNNLNRDFYSIYF